MAYYKELIENLKDEDVKSLMIDLGATLYKETDKYCIYNTICHNEDGDEASPKLYYYKDTKLFYCFTECGPMSIFKFLEHYYQTRNYDYDWYNDIYKVVESCSILDGFENFLTTKRVNLKEKYKLKERPQLSEYSPQVLDIFTHFYTPEWLEDGISKAAMDKYNILYSPSRNKIIIPHYDINGKLVGIRGRALNEWEVENVGKYTPVKIEETMYSHPLSLNLYGLYKTYENIYKAGYACIVESEKSVLQAESFSLPNTTCAICGSNLNLWQVKLLLQTAHPKEIILCLDKEEKQNEHKYFDKLYGICEKYKKYCNFSFVYDRSNLLELKDSPTDKGEAIFSQLLKERVKVK